MKLLGPRAVVPLHRRHDFLFMRPSLFPSLPSPSCALRTFAAPYAGEQAPIIHHWRYAAVR